MKNVFKKLCIIFTLFFLFVGINTYSNQISASARVAYSQTTINDFQGVANYIHKYGVLPSNYITKSQAYKLGWRPGRDLWDYAYGKSIGGDIFTNSEEVLPDAPGRVWHECDINYFGGHRGADRLLYSNDGLIYGTADHYQTFTCYYGDEN